MPEVVIDSIRVSLVNHQRVVVLKDVKSGLYLPIWIGASEADSIAVKMQGVFLPRPLTHDLLASVIDRLGGSLTHITINDLKDDTFFAQITIDLNGLVVDVDSRPSDAIAVAVRADVPIYVADHVLNKAGISLDDSGSPVIPNDENDEPRGIKEEDLRRMSAFTDFIDTLDIEDIGNEGQESSEQAS
jgi:bifunctional DNase/RNase